MPNLTLPSGQVISSQDPNYAEYVKTYGAPVDSTGTTSTSSVTPSLSLADAQTQAGTVLGTNSGLVSPMSLADIRSQQESATLASKQSAEAQFNPQISRTERAGAIELGSAVGSTGQRQGFNLSSGESMYLSAVQDSVNKRISEVENQMAAAINQGRVDAAEKAQASIDKLNEYNNNLIMKRADIAMNLVTQNQQQQQIDISREAEAQKSIDTAATQKLQAEQLALQAYETALKTPVGKDFTVNGITYTGLEDTSGIDPANITVSTDDKGYESGIDKTTGKILWKSKVPTGKSKTQATSVNVYNPSYTTQPGYSASTGQQYIWRTPDKDATGKTTLGYWTDAKGNKLDNSQVPADIKIGTFGAGNPVTDDTASLINAISGINNKK